MIFLNCTNVINTADSSNGLPLGLLKESQWAWRLISQLLCLYVATGDLYSMTASILHLNLPMILADI